MGTGTGSQAHRHRRGSGSRPGVPELDEAQDMVLDWEQLDIGSAKRSRSSSAVHFTEREHRAAWCGASSSELSEEGEEKEETLLGLA